MLFYGNFQRPNGGFTFTKFVKADDWISLLLDSGSTVVSNVCSFLPSLHAVGFYCTVKRAC